SGFVVGAISLGLGTAMVYPTLLASSVTLSIQLGRASTMGAYRLWRDIGYAIGACCQGWLPMHPAWKARCSSSLHQHSCLVSLSLSTCVKPIQAGRHHESCHRCGTVVGAPRVDAFWFVAMDCR